MGAQTKETLTFLDEDIARFMEEAGARRGTGDSRQPAGHYEAAFRVLGRYMDDQKPRDVFFFEQDGAFVLRLLMSGQAGSRHELAEFTRDDIDEMVARGPPCATRSRRRRPTPSRHPRPDHHRPATHRTWRYAMKALKTVAVALGITLRRSS